ncbi:protein of unknown function [Burkholderia multivorans]
MPRQAEDSLVTMLNIDAEITDRMARLAEIERSAKDIMAPWVNESRTLLQDELALLRKRREELFHRLNARLPGRRSS